MHSMVTIVNVLYIWKFLRVNLKCSHHKKKVETVWSWMLNKHCADHFIIFKNGITIPEINIILYANYISKNKLKKKLRHRNYVMYPMSYNQKVAEPGIKTSLASESNAIKVIVSTRLARLFSIIHLKYDQQQVIHSTLNNNSFTFFCSLTQACSHLGAFVMS